MSSETLLRRVKKVRISDTVVDQIVALIEQGQLKVGDQLPGERELVNQLQVGRASVREALRILEAQGVIQVQPGRGTFVTGDVAGLSGTESIKVWFSEHVDEIREIIELREALERRAAFLAATRASRQQIEEMQANLVEGDECVKSNDLERLSYLDQRFHSQLGDACGNELLSELISGSIEAMIHPRRSILRLPDRALASQQEHYAILQGIIDRDPQAAERAVEDHIESVRDAIASLTTYSQSHEMGTPRPSA
jgi:GntR family transcriptional regulator, transcriptional repressor for pyruvate dehydrogenase complex